MISSKTFKSVNIGFRQYSKCCPPRSPKGPCPCQPSPVPGAGKRVLPPSECRPGPIPPNPCVPRFHHGKDTWKKYKYILFFIGFPLIIVQGIAALGHSPPPKGECRDFEYMRRFTKRFPWKGGETRSFFHNDHVNFSPGECTPPPLDCD